MKFNSNGVANTGSTYLCENGLVITQVPDYSNKFVIRRFDPHESIDSKWDVLCEKSWGAAVNLCFNQESTIVRMFDTLEEAFEVAKDL